MDTTITEVTTSVTEMVTTTVTLQETSVDAEAVNTFVYLATGFLIFYFAYYDGAYRLISMKAKGEK